MENKNTLQSMSSLSTWFNYIGGLHNKTVDMSLERINKVADRLDILRPAPFVFTVAGTNGKGTTCCILEMVLIAAGYKVGVYSSPHLVRYTERVRIQNSELPESVHVASFVEIEAARRNISLTYFEYSTLSALWLFKQAKLDVVILEVGLGGRFDATNIVDSDIAIVTNIALDHTDWLGSDRESIGKEKAGIFRTGKLAIVGESNIPTTVENVAKEKKVRLLLYNINWYFVAFKNTWRYQDEYGELINLPVPRVPQINAATALAALRASILNVDEKAIREGIQKAISPGRFQIVSEAPRLILDVAHNPHAAAYLAERLKLMPKTGNILAVIGVLCDKDISSMLNCIKSAIDSWYCASLEGPRGASAEILIKHLGKGKIYKNVTQAWRAAMADAHPKDTVLVFGSFYTVAHVMKAIEGRITSDQ